MGEIVKVDEKNINGNQIHFYVVQIRDLMIWVAADEAGKAGLRAPTLKGDYDQLFAIFQSPGTPLPDDRFERKTQLLNRMKDGKLSSMCEVVRDLVRFRRTKKLNDYDNMILERARNFLMAEWTFSLSIPLGEAQLELTKLLEVPEIAVQ